MLSSGTIETDPPSSVAFNAWPWSQVRSATSWVLPIPGSAIFLPARSFADEMPAPVRTMNAAPPSVTPETTATLPEVRNSFTVGPGPMYVPSIAPASKAVLASLPELNVLIWTVVGERSRLKMPSAMPMSPGAWVRLGKTPSRRTDSLPLARAAELAHPVAASPTSAMIARSRFIGDPR